MPHDWVIDQESISLTAYFDDAPTEVNIRYNKYGGGVWTVYLNNYYHGRVWHTTHFGWQHDIRANSPLSFDDIETIEELITERVGPPED
jgi:hypothetical protein